MDDGQACKPKPVPVVGLVVYYPLPHPVWICALVGDTHLPCDLRRAARGDNPRLQELNISRWGDVLPRHFGESLQRKLGARLILPAISISVLRMATAVRPSVSIAIFVIRVDADSDHIDRVSSNEL